MAVYIITPETAPKKTKNVYWKFYNSEAPRVGGAP